MVPHWQRRSFWGIEDSRAGLNPAPQTSGRMTWRCLTLYFASVLCFLGAALGGCFVFFNALVPWTHYMPKGMAYPDKEGALILFVVMLLVASLSWWLIGRGMLILERARQLRFGKLEDEPTVPNDEK